MLYFTKLTRPVVKKWRGEGKQIMMYLDDGIGVHIDLQVCETLSDEVQQDLIVKNYFRKMNYKCMTCTCPLKYLPVQTAFFFSDKPCY